MKKIEIKTQAEFDAIPDDFEGEINITGDLERVNKSFENAEINVSGSATIRYVYDSATISNVSGSATIRYVSGSATIRYVYDSATISNVSGSATIRYVYDSATISNVSGSATISNVYDSATISNVSDSATISNVYGSATISNVYGSATISNVYGSATIRYVSGSATIRYVSGSATIRYVYDSATISNVYDSATISNVYGSACVLFVDGNAKVQTLGKNIVSYWNDKKVAIDSSKNTTIVILDRFNATWEAYTEMYPVEIKDGVATMYKTVHKIDGKYYSNHCKPCGNKLEYIIGEKMEHECSDNKDDSCDIGMHVSHKMWALNFGSWDDVALLELAVPIDKIVVAKDCDGKVRCSELTVIREIPAEEYYL